jgi:glycerol uptake facilitator-like aquaporin
LDLTYYTQNLIRTENNYKRQFLAEIIGTFLLISFGLAANAQRKLYTNNIDAVINVNLAGGLGIIFKL